MLEGVITTLVNKFLSKYVRNLDHHQLGLHLLGGELRLENVTLKGEAFATMHLPAEIEFGFIGLLHVQWNWTELMSKPLVVEVRDVLIVLREKSVPAAQHELEETGDDAPVDADKLHAAQLKSKLASLQSKEDFRLAPEVLGAGGAPGFFKKLLQAVIDNVRVHVKHVHVRYEHAPVINEAAATSTPLGFPVALGVVLNELTIRSTDEHWESKFVEPSEEEPLKKTHKMIDVAGVFVYCNTRENPEATRDPFAVPATAAPSSAASRESDPTGEEFTVQYRAKIDSMLLMFKHVVPPALTGRDNATSPSLESMSAVLPPDPTLEFLVHPINLSIRAIIDYKSGEHRAADSPLLNLKVLLPILELSISQRQTHALLHVVSNLAAVQKRLAVFSGSYHHESLDRAGTISERERYIELYKRTLNYSWQDTLSTTEGAELQEMEAAIAQSDIDAWRVCAMAELVAEMPPTAEIGSLAKRQKHVTGLLANVNNAAATVKKNVVDRAVAVGASAAAASATLATSILPGIITDKLGLTSKEQREEEESKTDAEKQDDAFTAAEAFENAAEAASAAALAAKEPQVHLTDDQRAQLRAEALTSSEILFLPTGGKGRDTIQATIDFTLGSLAIKLLDDSDETEPLPELGDFPKARPELFKLSLERVHAQVLQRIDSVRVALEVADFALEDFATEGTLYRKIISVKHAGAAPKAKSAASIVQASPAARSAASISPFISLTFESNPLDETADSKILVGVEPLEIVVHPAWIASLAKWAELPQSFDLTPLADGADAALMAELLKITRSSMEHQLSDHKSMSLSAVIGGPRVVILSNPLDEFRNPVLVVDVNSVCVHSRAQEKQRLAVVQDLLNQYTSKVQGTASGSKSGNTAQGFGRNKETAPVNAAGADSLEALLTEEKSDIDEFYDTLIVDITGVSISVSPNYNSSANRWKAGVESTPLLRSFDIKELAIDMCVAPHVTFLPATRIRGVLPEIHLDLSCNLVAQLTSEGFLQPWVQLGATLEARSRIARETALDAGLISQDEIDLKKVEAVGGAAPTAPASLKDAASGPEAQLQKQQAELQQELHESISVAEANPPAAPALSTLKAQEAAGFDFGVRNSLHPSESAWGSSGGDPDRTITLKELIIALKSEKVARLVLEESGAYSSVSTAKKIKARLHRKKSPAESYPAQDAPADETISLGQFQAWYAARKELLKLNKTMELDFSIAGVRVALIDDSLVERSPEPMPSSLSAVPPPLAGARKRDTMMEFAVLALTVSIKGRSFDNHIALELGSMMIECGGARDAQSSSPLLRTVALKKLPGDSSQQASAESVSAPKANPFLWLSLKTLSPESPDYARESCNTAIQLAIGELELNLDPAAVDQVGCFVLERLMPLSLRTRLAAESEAQAEAKNRLLAEHPLPRDAPTSPTEKHDPAQESEMLPVSERKVLVVQRNIDSLPGGFESVIALQLNLTLAGVTVNLVSRRQSFASLAVMDLRAQLTKRINQIEAAIDVHQLWVLDATAGMDDRDRAVMWIAQTIASAQQPTVGAAFEPAAEAKPFIHAHFQQYDVAHKVATGFAMALDAQVIGLRLRASPLFALHMLDYAQAGKNMRVLKVMETEKKLQADETAAKEAEKKQKEEEEAAALKAATEPDGSKPSVPALRKLRHRRPAKLKQKDISWSWSDDTPAPIQLDVLLDDIQIELPLLSLDNALDALAMTSTGKAAKAGEPTDATVEAARAVKRQVEQRKSEVEQSGMSSPLSDQSSCVGHSLIVRVESLRAKNILKDADKTSAHTLNETVRYEHFTASLGAIKILTTHGAIHGSPYFPLFSFHGLDIGANRFGHGALFEVKAELGCIDVALPHDQYVFLMRLADTAGEVATVFGEYFAANPPGEVEHKAMKEKVLSAVHHPKKLLVRAKDGSLESKEEDEARLVAREHRMDHRLAEEAEDAESDADEDLEDDPSESADPLKALPSLKIALHLTRFRVDLLQGDGLDPRRDSLLRVLLQDLNLNAALDQTTGDISADLALHVLSVTDTSVASNSRKQLLSPYRNILNFGVPTASLEEEVEQKEAGAPLQPLSKSKRRKLAKERSRSRAASMERAGAPSEATSSQPQQPEFPSTSSAMSSPPLLVRVHRQGYDSLHAIDVDASLNNLHLFLSPALLTMPKFMELPADLVEARKERLERQAIVAAETKERDARKLAEVEAELQKQPVPVGATVAIPVGVLASNEDKAAFAPSIDPLLMADALLTGSASASKHANDSANSKKTTPPIFARFRMTNPVILLVADPCAADTRGLVVTWGLDVSAAVGVAPGSMQAQLNLAAFSIIESGFLVSNAFGRDSQLAFSKTPEGAQKPILAPFTLRASVQNTLSPLFADGVAQSLTVDVHLSRIDLNVGFRLSQLLQASMNSLKPPEELAAESERSHAVKAIDEHKTSEEIRADIVTTIDSDRKGGAGGVAKGEGALPQDPLGSVVAAQPVPALNFTEINVSLKSSGVYVNVINDAWQTNLPFFRVQVESLLAKVHRMGDSGGVWGGLELRAEMYNHRILAWEPVIEPWSADFSAGQCQLSHTPAAALLVASTEQMLRNEHLMINGAAKAAPPVTSLVNPLAPITSISFTSTRPLNLNISAAALEDLADVAQEIQHAMHSDVAAWKRVSTLPLYRVENHTDLAMDVFRADLNALQLAGAASQASAVEDLEEVMHILPFSNAELDFSDQISSTVRAVRVQLLAAHGGLPSLTVPVARETSSKHELTPADGSGAIQVCVDVEWSKGVRVISIHSSMAVANQTNVPLIVSADRYQEKELVPGERMWLPLLVAPQMHTIRVKPSSLASRREFQRHVAHKEGVDAADVQELVTSVQGEFGWSEEIVLAAPQANTKQKSTLVDHFSCPPDRSLAALPSVSSLAAQEGKVSVESGASVDRRSSSLPSQSGAFHFTCFLSGSDVKDEHATVSAGIKTNLKRAEHARDAKASTFHIRTPITLENVLACEVQMRILNGPQLSKDKDEVGSLESARIVEELTLARGKTCPIYGATTAKDAFISLHIPTLAAGWSKPIKLKLSSTKSEVEMAQLVGDNGGTLYVCVELQQLQGNLRVVVYTQYWLWDLSSLSLQVTPDKQSILPQRAHTKPAVTGHTKQKEAHLESISLPDKHAAVMFSYESVKTSKKRLWARAGRHPSSNGFELSGPCSSVDDSSIQWSEWSEAFSVDAVGNQSALSLSMTPQDGKKHHHASRAGSYEIVADVQPGSGIFHRTKMVRFLPRYVLVNSLHVPIQVKQFGAGHDGFLTIAPSQQIIWHWPNAVIKNHPWLTMRRVLDPATSEDGSRTDDWHWSGYFDFDASTAADANLCVRHRHDAQRLWFPHLDVRPGRDGNGMSFLVLSETAAMDVAQLKMRLPYCIRNKSRNEYLRVRQWIDAKKHAGESSHLDEALAKEDAKSHKHHLLPMLHSKDDSASSSSSGVPSDDDSYGFTWRVVPPLSDLPFCYEEPLLDELAVQIQIGVIEGVDASGSPRIARWIEGSKQLAKLPLENFEEEHAFVEYSHVERGVSKLNLSSAMAPLAASRKIADPNKARLYFYTDQDGPTNFLVFADEPSDGWKKKQIHERQRKLKHAASATAQPGSDGMSKRRKVSTNLSAEEKEHVATEGQKVAQVAGGDDAGDEAMLGAQTVEQAAMPSAQSEIALAARKSHSRSSSASSDSSMRTVLETRPLTESGMRRPLPRSLQGAVPGAPFPVTARNLSDRVSQLRVRVVSAKSLRTKDKTLFAKVIFGDQVRQTDARKKEADSVAWNQEVAFNGADIGTRFAQHMQGKQRQTQREKEEAAAVAAAASAGNPLPPGSLGITSPTATPSAAVHRSRLPPRVHHPPLLFRRGSVPDQQHVFIDVYQCHTLLSNTRIGSVSLNINNISDQPGVSHWYELRKTKGANSEMRGMIQLAVWFELKEPTELRPQLSAKDQLSESAIKSEPQQSDPKEREAFAAEPRGQLATLDHAPPRDGSQETFAYAHANVYASAVTSDPETQRTPPQFEPLHPEDHQDETEHDEELEHVIAQMMEDESIATCSWSEYSVRIVDTLNLERVASALMVDPTEGRIVCYLTGPLFRRGYSVLISDRTETNMLKSWANQEILFAMPDQIAAQAKQDVVLRFSFYFYKSNSVNGQAPLPTAGDLQRAASVSTGSSKPILLGATTVPLLSIYTQKLDSLPAQKEQAPEMDESAHENEQVDVAHMDSDAKARHKVRRQMSKQKSLTPEEQAAIEWEKKWLPLGTPGQTSESASMCVRIIRREVKMPMMQAVSAADKLAAYAPPRLKVHLQLPLLGISLIDRSPEEVAYFALQNLRVHVEDSATRTSLRVALDKIQLDDLMHDAIYPVILSAAPVHPKEWMPVMQLAINKQKVPGVNIQCFEYVSFLLQTLDIKVNEICLWELLGFLQGLQAKIQPDNSTLDLARKDDSEEQALIYRRMSTELTLPPASISSLYFKFLHLQPLAINLTFQADQESRSQFLGMAHASVGNPLMVFLSVLEAGVGSLEGAPIRLDGKIIEHRLGSPESFVKILAIHYVKQGLSQLYKVFGSLAVLGNPVGTTAEIGRGVKSFFYEPAKGAMVSPEAFTAGLASGSMNLIRHSVSGLGGAVAGVFSSGGKAAAALSMDPDFVRKTNLQTAKEPEHVGQGLAGGAKSLASGVKEGITGLVLDPLHGAKQEGAKGFFKGLGTGIVGAFAKPVAGAMSMVAQTTKGIANTGDYLHDGPRARVHHMRPKRYIDPVSSRLTVYDARLAEEALEDEKLSAGDVARKDKRDQTKHETSTQIMASIDSNYPTHSNPQMTEAIRADNDKHTEQ